MTIDPLLFLSLQLFGRVAIMLFSEVYPAPRAASMRGISGGLDGACASGGVDVGVWGG